MYRKLLPSRLNPSLSLLTKQTQHNNFYTYSNEPSQPLNRSPTICSVEEAVKCVKSGIK